MKITQIGKSVPKKIILIIGVFLALAFFHNTPAQAANLEINYDAAAFVNGTSLNVTASDASVNLPWEWRAVTPAFDYSFTNASWYDPSRPMTLKISYDQTDNYFRQIFVFDSLSNVWRPLISQDNRDGRYLTASTTATQGRLIVLSNPGIILQGTASWYKYKNGLFAASPDFAKGSRLRVYNLANNKSVDVTINDWGPDRSVHPDRVIDLDKVAFQKIASPADGLINVRIEILKIAGGASKSEPQLFSAPTVTASSAVIMLEKTGEVLWGKNATTSAPLASLTKIVAMSVFLNTKPKLATVVTYKKQDENYNYQYCQPGEAAQLKVKDGEKMTEENLLYAALVGSANNAVESLVRVSGLTRPKFIEEMNKLAAKWGATSTYFVEPTGLSPQNVSSPYDYAIITKAAFANPTLQKITTTRKYSFKTINTKKAHTLTNSNRLIIAGTYPLIGSKTGYLDEAGHCLMTRLKTPQGNLIAVNFGSTSATNNFADNENLLRYGTRLLANTSMSASAATVSAAGSK